MELLVIVLALIVFAGVGAAIGKPKGRETGGAVLGLLLGPIGWILVAVGPDQHPKCGDCGSRIEKFDIRCSACGADTF